MSATPHVQTNKQRIAALPISESDFWQRVTIICRDANVTMIAAQQYVFEELSYNKSSALPVSKSV